MVEEGAKEAAPLSAAKGISRQPQSACLRSFSNAVLKKIFVGYRNQFTIELFALLTRSQGILGRQVAASLPGVRTIGGFASATIV